MTPYKQNPLDTLMEPVVRLLCRPRFMRFNQLALEFAYRLNGFGVWYRDGSGLPSAEEAAVFRTLTLHPPRMVFDVGANVGNFARLVRRAQPDCTILCFEPQPRTAETLAAKAQDLGITVERIALSSSPGSAKFYDKAGVQGSSVASLNKDSVLNFADDVVEFEVPVSTVDEYCRQNNVEQIDLLKIDTEGYDYHVLKGASEMITSNCVKIITFELIPACIETHVFFKDIFSILADFQVFRILPGGKTYKIPSYTYKYNEIFVPSSYIALHRTLAPA